MSKLYYTVFTVNGSGRFPLDMLRYDCCYPQTGDDAARIAATFERDYSNSNRKPITLAHKGLRQFWEPTAGRWSSFLWGVDPDSIVTVEHSNGD